MVSSAALACVALALPVSATAQIVNVWNKVDTVTAGEYDDLNPSLTHNVFSNYPGSLLRVVFERHTSTRSQIVCKTFDRSATTWDSALTVISSLPPGEEQKYPDYSEVSHYDTSAGERFMRIASWQVKKGDRWQLFFATLNDGSQAWSAPSVLVNDSLDNTGVQIRPFLDTAFIIIWKRANTVMWLMKSLTMTTPAETLAVGSSDSIEYDICTTYGVTGVIWTTNLMGKLTPLYRRITRYPQIQLSTPETLLVPLPCSRPRLAVSQTPDPTFLFETGNSGKRDVFYFIRNYFYPNYGSLTGDSLSESRNAQSFNLPIITKQGAGFQIRIPSVLGLVVYEKYRPSDSSLVFVNGPLGDTVRTPGHNWNAVVSSQQIYGRTGPNVLVVWESNRSGRGHLYSRLVPLYFTSITDNPQTPAAFELQQNYPNPFNPSTTIRFALGRRAHVTLTVFNTLGQHVATLVDGSEEAGYHDVRFDGSGLSSGVYFYRLQAGDFRQCRRLVILR